MRRFLVFLALTAACGDATPADTGTTLRMDFARPASIHDAPWPSDDLLAADGRPELAGFPNPNGRPLVRDALALIEESAHGFALAGGVFFAADAPLDASRLPSLDDSTLAASPVQLIGIDPGSPDYLRRVPVETDVTVEQTAYAPANLLSLVPLQGMPLRPRTGYAALVLRGLGDAAGQRLGRSPAMAALAAGRRPDGLSDGAWASYRKALAAIDAAGLDRDELAGLAAFTTDDPTAELARFRDHALAQPLPAPKRPFEPLEVFDDYCVFASALDMPDYQTGAPPYSSSGGGWPSDPAVDHLEEANLFVTIPRRAAPAGGFPLAVFVRTGGGGDRPLVDRGTEDADGHPLVPGTGPALSFARAGFAGIQVDGPLGGARSRGGDEQFTIFNIFNGRALRDNIRESALELSLLAHVAAALTVDASSCPGGPGGPVGFDLAHLAIMGHSTGAWITPLVVALEPKYQAAILSGAGASWIENILYKEKPLTVAPIVAGLLGRGALSVGDPVLTVVQWAAEPADPQVYARAIVREPAAAPRHVLMEQGIVDHYILPRIANSASLALGLDLAGAPLDAAAGLPAAQLPLAPLLPLGGRASIALPASANRGGATAVVVQHPEDGVQDGHEMVFQRDEPKREIRCFLETLAAGTPPRVVDGTVVDGPCGEQAPALRHWPARESGPQSP